MKVILSAIDPELAEAWKGFCGDLNFVEIHRGSILQASCDAVVSPANSFGFMDGGVDLSYSEYFGWHVQERLQEMIATKHHGELLVGAAEIVETDDSQIPYLIAAPTMRVPMILGSTINPFLAARAALILINHGVFATGRMAGKAVSSVVKSVAFPGLGTGVGRVAPTVCAHQVRAAINEVILRKPGFPRSWHDAQERHQKLYTRRIRDLQEE